MGKRRANRRKTTAAARWKRRAYLEDSLAWYLHVASQAMDVEVREELTDNGSVVVVPSYTSAINARKEADRIRGEIDQLDQAVAVAEVPDLDAMWAELLIELRQLRAAATAGSSFVAATRLLKLEHDMVEAEKARRDAQGPPPQELQEVLEQVRRVVDALPPVLQAQLGGLLGELLPAEA